MVLDEEVPWPLNSGKRIRAWNLLRRLARHHELHLFTYGPVTNEARAMLLEHAIGVTAVDPLPPSSGAAFWLRLGANLFSEYPYSVTKHFTARLQTEVTNACQREQFDVAHIEWVPYASYQTPRLPRVLDAHNVESDIWKRRAQHSRSIVGRRFFGLQARRMEKFERRESRVAECVVTVSELDAQRFRSYGAKASVVPNGVDLEYFQPAPNAAAQSASLLFLGSLDWFPNQDAVMDFALHTLPVLRRKNHAITLRVVGRRPSEKLAGSLRELQGVELIGEVPDVRTHIARACAVVVPLRIGGGTRIKILEAMAMGKPVISTSVGAEGLEIEDGRDLLIANTADEFVAKISALLSSPEQQLRLGRNGRDVVQKLYGWDAAAEKLEQAWITAAGAKRPATARAMALEEAAR